jgi:hypothetical protein
MVSRGRSIMNDRQLGWVQQNRGRTRATPPLAGDLARDFLAAATAGGKGWRTRLMALLEEHAGAGLLDYAEPLSVTRGTLTFAVSEPAILYHLRLQWEQRLLQLFQSLLPEAGISAIRFTTNRPR